MGLVAIPEISTWTLSDATKLSAALGLAQIKGASDNFADGVRGWQWSLYGNSTPTESGGVLTCSPTVSNSYGGYVSYINHPAGDFDMRVSVSGLTWTGLAGGRLPLIEMACYDGVNYAYIRYYANGVTDYRFQGGVSGTTGEAIVTTTSGQLRIVREGTTVRTYYKTTGDWVLVYSKSGFVTTASQVIFYAQNSSGAYPTVNFDDFIAHDGGWYPNDSPTAESPWIACPYKTLGSITWPENTLGGTGNIKYQYATNNGAYNGSWVTLAAMSAALASVTITDTTNSLRVKAQFNSDGTQLADIVIAGSLTATDLDYPAENKVELNTVYGIGAYTGTLVATCDYPATSDVRDNTVFNNGLSTGTLDLPVIADVRLNTTYDNATKTGTLDPALTVLSPLEVIDITPTIEVINL